ncbi:hypothetical protein LAZ67_X002195 [Cordylochernes scorpioides]|uniref:ATP-dependent DNA helicase n=1 Tax=Cordylochernes scorpioides TaxID=51811 RepID=A0ABY6LT68_9ARAC|nr:hypothetical protein LAZ67_X002195 [Cordylochernes scorpioides]
MIHGPCGHGYPDPGCMERGICQKKYPRLLLAETQTDRDGYPLYRRRRPEEGGFSFVKRVRVFTIENGVQVVRMTNVTSDNRYVVPYSPLLCRLIDAHINVESCASISAIKYICKYIYKGSDQSIFAVTGAQTESNEVLEYQHGRYISSNEAVWRTLGFPIHRRHPMVQHLSVYLENGQRVYFTSANAALQAHRPPKTTLTELFALCQRDNFAKTLLYVEVPVYYIWSASKSWQPRKQGTRIADQVDFASDAIGRVYTVHPNFEECFYLRMLLHSVRGPTYFAALRTINGVLCQTYKEACLHLGLFENDQQRHHCIQEAVLSESPLKIRELFAIILTCCHPTNPQDIWAQFKEPMSADILNLARQQANGGLLQLTYEMSNQALILSEQKVLQMTGFHLKKFGMRSPQRNVTHRTSHELLRETSYKISRLLQLVGSNEPKLANVPEKKEAYERILSKIDSNAGGLYFLDAPGGTGKTFLINLLLTKVRSTGDIALSTASSGIAATLLHGGRTAHATFKLPLDLTRYEKRLCPTSNYGNCVSNDKYANRTIEIDLTYIKNAITKIDTCSRKYNLRRIIYILLLISGIEQNPGPKYTKQTTLDSSPDKNIRELIVALSDKMEDWHGKLETNLSSVEQGIEKLDRRIQQLETMMDNTAKSVSMNPEKIREMDTRIEFLEMKMRENNLIFHGVEGNEGEDSE